MRRRGRSFGALLMVALAACSSGGAPTGAPPPVSPASTTTGSPPSTAATTSTTSADAPVDESTPTIPEGTVASELGETAADRFQAFVEAEGDGPRAALVEFALSFGPVDGVDTSMIEPLDESWGDSFTSALLGVEAHWDGFTDAERSALAARYVAVLGPGSAAGGVTTTVAGLRRSAATSEWQGLARAAEQWLAGQLDLGADLDYEVTVASGSGGVGASTRPSWGTAVDGLLADWVRDEYGVDAVPRDIACDIRILDASELDENSKRSVIAHELFHCFSMTHLGLGPHSTTRKWVQEGLATWVGETYVGGSSYQAHRWNQYLEGGPLAATWPLFPAQYSAFPFWATVDAMTGDLFPHVRSILEAATGSDASAYGHVLSLLPPDQVASIAAAAANRPSLGGAWLLTGPGAPGLGRGSLAPQELRGGEVITWTTPVGSQSNRSLRIAERSEWLVVEVGLSGSARSAWTRGPEQVVPGASRITSYCVDGPCVCADGNPAADGLVDAAGELVLATTGGSTPTEATVRALTEADLCGPDCSELLASAGGAGDATGEGAPSGGSGDPASVPPEECLELDPCVVGTWLADPSETAAFALATFRFAPVTPTFLGGTLRFEFAEDGTFREVAEGIRFQVTIDGITGEQTYTRIVTGIWFVAGDGVLRTIPASQVTDIQQSIAGIAAPPIRNEVGPEGLTAADFGYTCSPTSLVLTHDAAAAWSFPQQWTRTS